MAKKADSEIIAKCMENIKEKQNDTKLIDNDNIYKVHDIYGKKIYFFCEPRNDKCNSLFDKLNRANSKVNTLSDKEKALLDEIYPNQSFLSNMVKYVKAAKDFEIVKFFIKKTDTILDIKRKIMLHTELYYNNIHLWANVKVSSNALSKKLQNVYLTIERKEADLEFKEDFSTFNYNAEYNYLDIDTKMSLGIHYEVDNGLILVNPDPRKVLEEMPICNVVSSSEECLFNYNIDNNDIFMMHYDTYLDKHSSETLKNYNVLKYFFPNYETDTSFMSENVPLVNANTLRNIELTKSILLEDSDKANIQIGYEGFNNVVIQVNKPANFFKKTPLVDEIDLLRIFENITLDETYPFIRYRDSDGKCYNRVAYKNLENVYQGGNIVNVLNKYDLRDSNYIEEYLPTLKSSKIQKKDLLSWTKNLQSYRERQQLSFERSKIDLPETKGIEEINLKIKMSNPNPEVSESSSVFNDNYMTLIVKKNGHLIIKFLNNKGDITLESLLCVHLERVSNVITDMNKLSNSNIPMFIPNIRNPTESTNIEYTTIDSNIENIKSDLPISFKSINDNFKNLMPNFFGFDASRDLNELKMLYKSVNGFQSYNNIRNHFLFMREEIRNKGKFLDKWKVDCDHLFGLSLLESIRIFENISEELEVNPNIKIGKYNDLHIEVELKHFTDKLFSLKIMNCNSLELLNEIKTEIIKFLNICAKQSIGKDKTKDKTKGKAAGEKVEPIVPKVQISTTVIPIKSKTLIDNAEDDFSESEVDEFDEFDDDVLEEEPEPANNNVNRNENGPVVQLDETSRNGENAGDNAGENAGDNAGENAASFSERKDNEALRTYAPRVRKLLDSTLFDYKKTSENEQYSRLCGAVDNRQPIILTEKQWNHFERINPDAFHDAENMYLRWGSDKNHMNYYICPRIFCFHNRCMFPLTPIQLIENNGECFNCGSGIMNKNTITTKKTILIRRGGSNKYWSETIKTPAFIQEIKDKYPEKWNEYLEFTEKIGIPGFIDPKSHPNDLCMPCCFSGLEITNVYKNVEKCMHHHVSYYIKIIEKDAEKVPELVASFISTLKLGETIRVNDKDYILKLGDQILISGNSQYMGVFKITEKTAIPVKTFTSREFTRLLPNTVFTIDKDSYKSWSSVKYTVDNEIITQRSIKDDYRYIITWNRRPIPSRRLGKLPVLLDRLFRNDIERDLKKGYLIPGLKSIVLREGINNNNKNSFLCAIINKFILNGDNLTLSNFLKEFIEDLKIEEFLEVNNGDLVQQFAPNIENIELRNKLVEMNFNKFVEFAILNRSLFKTPPIIQPRKYKMEDLMDDLNHSNINRNKKISKKNKKIRELFLTFHSFEFFKKYLGDQNIYKDYKLLWNLFALKCPIGNKLDTKTNKKKIIYKRII